MDIEIIDQIKNHGTPSIPPLHLDVSTLTHQESIFLANELSDKPTLNQSSYHAEKSKAKNIKIMNGRDCIYVVIVPKNSNIFCKDVHFTSEMLKQIETALNKAKIPHFFRKITIHATDYELKVSYEYDENVVLSNKTVFIYSLRLNHIVDDCVDSILSPTITLSTSAIKEFRNILLKDMEKNTKVKLPSFDYLSIASEYLFTKKEISLIRFLKEDKHLISVTPENTTLILTYQHNIQWKYDYAKKKISRPKINLLLSSVKTRKNFIKPLNDIARRSSCSIKKVSVLKDMATIDFGKAGEFSFSYHESYKAKLNQFFKNYEKELQKKKEEEQKKIEKLPYFGTLIGIAVVKTVLENEKYITEGSLIRELRGLKHPYPMDFKENEFTGKMNLIRKEEFKKVVHSFIKNDVFYTYTLKGTYGNFDILKIGKVAECFLELSKNKKHHKLSEMTEYELQEFLKKDDPSKRDVSKTIDRLDFYIEHRALYCCQHDAYVAFLQKMPDKAKEYLLALSKIEESRSEKIFLKKLYNESIEKQ